MRPCTLKEAKQYSSEILSYINWLLSDQLKGTCRLFAGMHNYLTSMKMLQQMSAYSQEATLTPGKETLKDKQM